MKKGGRYFYTHNMGLQNQAVLFVRDSVNGEGRALIDPNPWAKDGATALAEWEANEQGTKLLYAIQDGGTDWRTLKVRDVKTGKDLSDTIKWVKFSGLSWAKDGSGFYYSRFVTGEGSRVYYHTMGSPNSADKEIFGKGYGPDQFIGGYLTENFGWEYIFYVNVVPGAIMIGMLYLSLEASPMKLSLLREGDWLGIITIAIGLSACATPLATRSTRA